MSTNEPYREETIAERRERLRRIPIPPAPPPRAAKAPTLTLAASTEPGAEQVASVALEPADVATVREALAHRRMRIGGDIVGFDKVTHARVTMRWTRCTPAPEFGRVVSDYNPFARNRLPGGDGE
jgi:hypothetical protein